MQVLTTTEVSLQRCSDVLFIFMVITVINWMINIIVLLLYCIGFVCRFDYHEVYRKKHPLLLNISPPPPPQKKGRRNSKHIIMNSNN